MKKVILALFCILPLSAQYLDPTIISKVYWYSAHNSAVVSSSVAAFTVQALGTTAAQIYMDSVTVQSSVDLIGCKIEVTGTAATTTTGTIVKLNTSRTAEIASFTSSNVGAGTIIITFNAVANVPITIGLQGIVLPTGTATTRNVTMRAPSATGTVNTTFRMAQPR